MAVFEEIHLRRGGAVPYVVAFFRRPASVRTGDQSCPLSTMRTTRSV